MKYKVTITQYDKYSQDIIGTFISMMDVQALVETVFAHFKNVSVNIEVDPEESEVAKDE